MVQPGHHAALATAHHPTHQHAHSQQFMQNQYAAHTNNLKVDSQVDLTGSSPYIHFNLMMMFVTIFLSFWSFHFHQVRVLKDKKLHWHLFIAEFICVILTYIFAGIAAGQGSAYLEGKDNLGLMCLPTLCLGLMFWSLNFREQDAKQEGDAEKAEGAVESALDGNNYPLAPLHAAIAFHVGLVIILVALIFSGVSQRLGAGEDKSWCYLAFLMLICAYFVLAVGACYWDWFGEDEKKLNFYGNMAAVVVGAIFGCLCFIFAMIGAGEECGDQIKKRHCASYTMTHVGTGFLGLTLLAFTWSYFKHVVEKKPAGDDMITTIVNYLVAVVKGVTVVLFYSAALLQ